MAIRNILFADGFPRLLRSLGMTRGYSLNDIAPTEGAFLRFLTQCRTDCASLA